MPCCVCTYIYWVICQSLTIRDHTLDTSLDDCQLHRMHRSFPMLQEVEWFVQGGIVSMQCMAAIYWWLTLQIACNTTHFWGQLGVMVKSSCSVSSGTKLTSWRIPCSEGIIWFSLSLSLSCHWAQHIVYVPRSLCWWASGYWWHSPLTQIPMLLTTGLSDQPTSANKQKVSS